MICPGAPPSAATSKVSGSTWLDRLRSSRGFPPADARGLGHFLASQSSDSAAADPARLLKRHAVDESRARRLGEEKGEDLSDILCELFAMGGGRGGSSNCACKRRKSARKQRNPMFWDGTGSSKKSSIGGSSDDLKRRNTKKNNDVNLNCNNNGLASSGDNSLNQLRKERDSKDPGELGLDVEEPEEADLKGYSKSEVTVIDSSIQGWKVEMVVFRKRKSKSVWKVREKKSGSRSLVTARRKRKLAKSNSSDKEDDYEDDDDDEDSGDGEERRKKRKKKKIVRVSDSPPGSSFFKNGNRKEAAVLPLINEGQARDDKVDQTLKGVGCLRGEAPIKSFPCSSSHWKSKSGTSSVILVKPISTFDKIGIKKPSKISLNKGQQS